MNLLTETPYCHRELFRWKEGNKVPKSEYTVEDLFNYYLLTYYPQFQYSGSYITVDQLKRLKDTALNSTPSWWTSVETDKLTNLCKKYGLETVLYAMDLVQTDEYPTVEVISAHIEDGSIILANLKREL